MGVVYEARDERLDRSVAVKMIRDEALDPRSRERFLREARLAARLTHPNVCQLFDLGEDDGNLYFAMELLDGESLAARIAREPLAPLEAAQIVIAMLSALSALHRQGVIHRDCKPSNVFLTPVGVKLLDFGLARAIESSSLDTNTGVTIAGTVMGTPQYLALGQPLDARADLFAVGVVLHEMLTGTPMFSGSSIIDILHAVVHQRPSALAGSPLVIALDRVIHRAVAKTPDDRFASADDMADAIRGVMVNGDSGEVVSAPDHATGRAAAAHPAPRSRNRRDPCGRYYLARMLAQTHHPRALEALRQSVDGGFVPYAFLLRDPALDSLRGTVECRTVLELARTRFEQASISFHAADGPRLLGMTDVARS